MRSLTHSEAIARAELLERERVRHRSRSRRRPRGRVLHLDHHRAVHLRCPRRRDLRRAEAGLGAGGACSTARPLDPAALVGQPAAACRPAGRERAGGPGARCRTRTPARACTGSPIRRTARSTSTPRPFLDDAQRIFACFDQPDLKAPVTLTVTAPPRLDGLRPTAPATQTAPGPLGVRRHPAARHLPRDAGRRPVPRAQRRARRHRASACTAGARSPPHLDKDADEIFDDHQGCLDRFHELFGIRYPFGKYDQAFVPEFNAGAMENPGCVTFRDEFIFRSAVTDADREMRAVVIAHEMAHMWFGDLVTMRWWDDLWLNESFAEYMGWRVTAEATRVHRRLDQLRGRPQGLGIRGRPAPVHPSGRARRRWPTPRRRCSTSTASPTPRAPRCCASWWPGSATRRSSAGVRAHFAAPRLRQRHPGRPARRAVARPAAGTWPSWAEVWLRRAQVNTLRPEVDAGARRALPARWPSCRPRRRIPDPAPAPHRHRRATTVTRPAACCCAAVDVDLDPAVDGGRTPVAELAGVPAGAAAAAQRRRPDLREDPVRRGRAGRPAHVAARAGRLRWPGPWSGRAAADATRDAELPAAEFVALAAAGLPAETEVAVFQDVRRRSPRLGGPAVPGPLARPAHWPRWPAPARGRSTARSPAAVGSSRPSAVW